MVASSLPFIARLPHILGSGLLGLRWPSIAEFPMHFAFWGPRGHKFKGQDAAVLGSKALQEHGGTYYPFSPHNQRIHTHCPLLAWLLLKAISMKITRCQLRPVPFSSFQPRIQSSFVRGNQKRCVFSPAGDFQFDFNFRVFSTHDWLCLDSVELCEMTKGCTKHSRATFEQLVSASKILKNRTIWGSRSDP